MAKRMKVADGVRFANQLIIGRLSWVIWVHPVYSKGSLKEEEVSIRGRIRETAA